MRGVGRELLNKVKKNESANNSSNTVKIKIYPLELLGEEILFLSPIGA